MLLPAEPLTAQYGEPIRRLLLDGLAAVNLFMFERHIVFRDSRRLAMRDPS
jgi:hypothetical protein